MSLSVRILGASGGIGPNRRTTSILIDEDILIDAGSGVGDLTLGELQKIRHVFLTHSHLDHIGFLPMLADMVYSSNAPPIQIHALPPTLKALREHVFNWVIWPDFTCLPSPEQPLLQFRPIRPDQQVSIGLREVHTLPALHTVPAIGYGVMHNDGVGFAFTGDTSSSEALWEALNALPYLDLLMIESGLPDEMDGMADLAKHYTPHRLADDLDALRHQPRIAITHLKPGHERAIRQQLQQSRHASRMVLLEGSERFELHAQNRALKAG
ncbi:cyclic-AMP phosphodiesterase [Thioalkalivibrio sp. K90mix]|uniref:MBL fold metallo-hydrolase n=1 Tax=Thioalkalivibrio sp. (strain K90mix) TaxID=396595 RepID=UPI000195A937|nr:3',5'-cyclic-nucleotide phosphodiesterase [Thioalkalivibrio sp. K90mix]ADC71475.1 cyclic-AMP phosphodiesterase [Thioalkalivibrio sp. K90mix]